MNRHNQLWLLEAEDELQRLKDLSETLARDASGQLLRLLLCQVEYLIAEAERITAMTEASGEPMPWWQDWQRRHQRGAG